LGLQFNIDELKRATGKGYRTIKKRLADSGVEPVKTQGRSLIYDTEQALAAIYAGPKTKEDLSLEVERAKLAVEQSRKAKRENDLAEGQVADVEILTDVLVKVSANISSTLDALAIKLKKQNPNLLSNDIELIRKQIARCKNETSDLVIHGKYINQ